MNPKASKVNHYYMFIVVNLGALPHASDFRIERRQIVIPCRMQDANSGSLKPNCQQTEYPLTNGMSYRDQAKNLNSITHPFDQQTFSPLDPTAGWLSHLALSIDVFVIVDFDVLAQASNFRVERRQVVFPCWMQDSNPWSPEPADGMPLTNTLSNRWWS